MPHLNKTTTTNEPPTKQQSKDDDDTTSFNNLKKSDKQSLAWKSIAISAVSKHDDENDKLDREEKENDTNKERMTTITTTNPRTTSIETTTKTTLLSLTNHKAHSTSKIDHPQRDQSASDHRTTFIATANTNTSKQDPSTRRSRKKSSRGDGDCDTMNTPTSTTTTNTTLKRRLEPGRMNTSPSSSSSSSSSDSSSSPSTTTASTSTTSTTAPTSTSAATTSNTLKRRLEPGWMSTYKSNLRSRSPLRPTKHEKNRRVQHKNQVFDTARQPVKELYKELDDLMTQKLQHPQYSPQYKHYQSLMDVVKLQKLPQAQQRAQEQVWNGMNPRPRLYYKDQKLTKGIVIKADFHGLYVPEAIERFDTMIVPKLGIRDKNSTNTNTNNTTTTQEQECFPRAELIVGRGCHCVRGDTPKLKYALTDHIQRYYPNHLEAFVSKHNSGVVHVIALKEKKTKQKKDTVSSTTRKTKRKRNKRAATSRTT